MRIFKNKHIPNSILLYYPYHNEFLFVRFETQEDTGKHLQELQNRAEKEIRDLGSVKESLEQEWELVKFMGQEENTELREKLEILEEDITDQQVGNGDKLFPKCF